MAVATAYTQLRPIHPLHALVLAFPVPFFLGALISDLAYWNTYHIQWSNFSSWMIAGGLVGGGLAMLWALVNLFRYRRTAITRHLVYFILLLVTWVLGFINALVHAKDAWATTPEGLVLSAVTTVLAFVAAWIGYSGFQTVEVV